MKYCVIIALLTISTFAQIKFSDLSGPYLGQKPPETNAEIFAPGIISTEYKDLCVLFTPDAREVYFTVGGFPQSVVFFSKEVNGHWTEPEVASFSGRYSSESTLSEDGNTIYLCSDDPGENITGKVKDWGILITERNGDSWTTPYRLPAPVNTDDKASVYPSAARNGNLYFCSAEHQNGFGGGDILMSESADGKYNDLILLDKSVNSEHWEIDPFIAPDESYLIFSSNRPDSFGKNDLYISFIDDEGEWTTAINMGENVNSNEYEIHPYVSADGKYLFFCSTRSIKGKGYSEDAISYEKKLEALKSPGNGWEDIYWVSSEIIDNLRQEGK